MLEWMKVSHLHSISDDFFWIDDYEKPFFVARFIWLGEEAAFVQK